MSVDQQASAEAPVASRSLQQLDLYCERGVLGVVLLIVLWGPLAFGAVPAPSFLVIQALTIVGLLLWAVRMWTQPSCHLLWPPICWAVLAFLVYALVRCRLVLLEYPGRQELIQVVVYASLFFLIINNILRRESNLAIPLCLIVLGLALSWYAVFQFATDYPRVWGYARRAQFLGRGGATYINPNHLAGFLGMTVPLALAYTLMSRFKPTMKVLFAYCALAMLAGIGVTISRGGMIAAAATLFVFCLVLLFQRGYWLPSLAVLIALVVLGVAFSMEFESVQRRFENAVKRGQVADIRVHYWPAAIQMSKEHPMWGIGPGQFDAAFSRYRPPSVQNRPVYAHNDYLNTLAEWGVAGMAIIAAACGLLYYGAWRIWPCLRQVDSEPGAAQKSDKAAFVMGACMGLLAVLFHSVVDFDMHVPANAAIAVTLMALISGNWRFATERYWIKPGLPGKAMLTIAIAAAIAWLGVEGLHKGREAYWQRRAADESIPPEEKLAGLEKAYEAEPNNFENSYNVGEFYRLASLEANAGYENQAKQALQWYAKSMASNPLDPIVPARCGMCLDWLGQTNESGAYFDLALKLDTNSAQVAYFVGRHCLELGDLAAARRWFVHSNSLQWTAAAQWAFHLVDEKMRDPNGLYKPLDKEAVPHF